MPCLWVIAQAHPPIPNWETSQPFSLPTTSDDRPWTRQNHSSHAHLANTSHHGWLSGSCRYPIGSLITWSTWHLTIHRGGPQRTTNTDHGWTAASTTQLPRWKTYGDLPLRRLRLPCSNHHQHWWKQLAYSGLSKDRVCFAKEKDNLTSRRVMSMADEQQQSITTRWAETAPHPNKYSGKTRNYQFHTLHLNIQ